MGHLRPRMSIVGVAGGLVGLGLVSNCNVQGRFIDGHCMIPNANGVVGDDACRDGEGYCTPGNINIEVHGMVECNLGRLADERGCVYDDADKATLDDTSICRFECGLSAEALACVQGGMTLGESGLDCLRALYIGDPDDSADDGVGLRKTECPGSTTGSVCPSCESEAPFCDEKDGVCSNDCSVVGDGDTDANAACAWVDPNSPFCVGGGCVECVGDDDCDIRGGGRCVDNECVDRCGNACEGNTPICTLEGDEGACVECTEENVSACSAEKPFCNIDSHVCVNCGELPASVDADMACESFDPSSPACNGDSCVLCTAANDMACTGNTPVCDDVVNQCVVCTDHDQCGAAACNFFTGACLPSGPGDVVRVGVGQEFSTIGEAVASFDMDAEGTVIVHEGVSYNEAVMVDGGRVIAFLANGGQFPQWTRVGGEESPQLTVRDSTVLMDGLRISSNLSTMDPAVLVDSGRTWVDRGRIVQNAGGGVVVENDGEIVLRNSFVGDGTNGFNTLVVDGASAEVLYSTLGVGFSNFEYVFPVYCRGNVTVSIRNSILVSLDNSVELSCNMATVMNSASESLLPGMGNVALGDVGADWFLGIDVGDFYLENPPPMLATTALWEVGDPLGDIDEDDIRPGVAGAADYAGADAL